LIRAVAQGDTDARGDDDLMRADVEWSRQSILNSLGDFDRFSRVVDIFGHHREFISTKPRERIGGPHASFKPPRERDKQLVAYQMTEAIVDDLEAVEVEEQQGEHPLRHPLDARHCKPQMIHEERPARQAGERIAKRVRQPLFGSLSGGDVLDLKYAARRDALQIARYRRTHQSPHCVTESVNKSLLHRIDRNVGGEHVCKPERRYLDIVRMDETRKVIRAHLIFGIPEDLAERVVGLQAFAVGTDQGHSDRCVVESAVKPFFALLELLEVQFRLARVRFRCFDSLPVSSRALFRLLEIKVTTREYDGRNGAGCQQGRESLLANSQVAQPGGRSARNV